jgi:hypothetical protein
VIKSVSRGLLDTPHAQGMTTEAGRQQKRRPYLAPDGQISKTCLAPLQKIFCFSEDPNHLHNRAIPSHSEGRFAIVT